MKRLILLLCFAGVVFSCGPAARLAGNKGRYVPTQAEADSIIGIDNAAVFVVEKPTGPAIYAFALHKDSAMVDVHYMSYVKKYWYKAPVIVYPCGDEMNLPLVSGPDSMKVIEADSVKYLTFLAEREKDGKYQKIISVYRPKDEMETSITFNGRRRSDGKVYGETSFSMHTLAESDKLAWADSILKADPQIVPLTREQIMSDQAIEWWMKKNPYALTGASRIYFGHLPEECTLVQQYRKAKKEQSQTYSVALFDTLDHTVIVSRNRSTGQYSLVWVEPRCLDRKTDRLLNSIYFSGSGRLAMFYYKGNSTFKYNLSLLNGQIQR